jgi:hypothetical protein
MFSPSAARESGVRARRPHQSPRALVTLAWRRAVRAQAASSWVALRQMSTDIEWESEMPQLLSLRFQRVFIYSRCIECGRLERLRQAISGRHGGERLRWLQAGLRKREAEPRCGGRRVSARRQERLADEGSDSMHTNETCLQRRGVVPAPRKRPQKAKAAGRPPEKAPQRMAGGQRTRRRTQRDTPNPRRTDRPQDSTVCTRCGTQRVRGAVPGEIRPVGWRHWRPGQACTNQPLHPRLRTPRPKHSEPGCRDNATTGQARWR